jgi:hypothetical protein
MSSYGDTTRIMHMNICPFCGAMDYNAPHGIGTSCPWMVDKFKAQIDLLYAQQKAHIRSGQSVESMTDLLRKMTGTDEDDE